MKVDHALNFNILFWYQKSLLEHTSLIFGDDTMRFFQSPYKVIGNIKRSVHLLRGLSQPILPNSNHANRQVVEKGLDQDNCC